MQVKLLNVLCFLLALVVPAVFADEAKLITKDGVVYSYAVRTKTLRPATVVISTSYYTTVEVREITLSNNKVTSTTEQITTEATITTSLSAVISNPGSSSDFTTTSVAIQDLSNTLSTSVPQVSSTTTIFSIPATESHNVSIGSTQSTRTLSTSQVNTDILSKTTNESHNVSIGSTQSTRTLSPSQVNTDILSQTTTESHNMSIENIQSTRTLSPSQVTTSVVPKTTTLSTSTNSSYSRIPTTMTSISQARNTSNSQGILTTSVNSNDRVCYVYYEDDEYYSTFYITAPSQTIDAASTITSTRTKTIYQTISS